MFVLLLVLVRMDFNLVSAAIQKRLHSLFSAQTETPPGLHLLLFFHH